MVGAALRSTDLQSDRSFVVGHDEVVELCGGDAGRTADLTDGAGEGLGVGEGLTLITDGVDDEADLR